MRKKPPEDRLDGVDLAILDHLQADGRLTNAKLAERLALSETPCWRRLKRLEDEGYIDGYQANLNRRRLGYSVLAFVQLTFNDHSTEAAQAFKDLVLARPEVLSCHNITGEADYLLQVVAADLDSYSDFVDGTLRNLRGVISVRSGLSLREIKSSSRLPLRRQ